MRLKDYIALWLLCSIYISTLVSFSAAAEPVLIDNRYEIIEDGSVVRDVITGLEWQRCSVGQSWDGSTCSGFADRRNWDRASIFNNDGDFVLPDIDQLRSLLYCAESGKYGLDAEYESYCLPGPTINRDVFPNTPVAIAWASPNYIFESDSVLSVNFQTGDIYEVDRTEEHFFRQVRLPATFNLTVSTKGDGAGSITSNIETINCGAACSADVASRSSVVLSATAAAGSVFANWEGCNIGSDDTFASGNRCLIGNMKLSRTISATFTTLPALSIPTLYQATDVTIGGFRVNWNAVPGATGYRLDVTTSDFGNILPEFNNLDVGNVSNFVVSGLSSDTTYKIRLKAYNSEDISEGAFTSVTTSSDGAPNYSVSATAGGGGSITPALSTVSQGRTATFTIVPDEGYYVETVTGCNGALTWGGYSSYTTGAISEDCAVTVSFAASDTLIDNRYQIIGDGSVVRDVVTWLEWQRCSVGQSWTGSGCSGEASRHTLAEALQLGAEGGFTLPNRQQLRSLVYCSNTGRYDSNGDDFDCGAWNSYTSPTINTVVFSDSPGTSFWSAPPAERSWHREGVDFSYGYVFSSHESNRDGVRLVRAGQPSAVFSLTVQKQGSGSGTISSSPAGISCGATCSAEFVQGAVVILTATAQSGSNFVSWSGCSSVSANQCTVSMSQARTVVAVFQPQQALITVSLSDGGQLLEASVNEQGTQAVYELAPNAGFRLSRQVGGSCPAGQWLSSLRYETGVTQSSCTVHFNFVKTKRRSLPVWLFIEQN
ncbi:DUF1566 domain-containing protein [Rheinheimera baltica]|uniref:DUF1566 domain-containing protein n=1 Tax=Rheinheimera baltica TaxID=67576 RepID=A0ABT9I1S2_9GAMM|nr:DUF1566 domain-containing protein [Rheinheimera baltica]MDP5137334.1 DUF1566 domain-containing protein [Rheinheimera baltica]